MLEEDGRLRNLEAENYILNQRISAEWIYASEEWKKEARQFCVKGLAEIDMLKEIQAKLEEAQRKGLGLRQFKKQIVPYLQEKGWLGGDEKEIGHRVRIIFDTNLASARAAARWQKIQETKDKMPYLQYLPSLSADKRDEHKAFYGLIARADDEIWQRIFPPNGYNCKCRTRQLTEREAQRLIKEQEENGGRITVDNNAINKAVDSSFQHCHKDLSSLLGYVANKKRTNQDKKQGITPQKQRIRNLRKSIALQKGMLNFQAVKKAQKELREDDFKGKLKGDFSDMKALKAALIKNGDTLLKVYAKDIEKGIAEGKTPYEIFSPILKKFGAEGGNFLDFSYSANIPKTYIEILDEAFSHFPKKIINLLNKSDINFIVSTALYGSSADLRSFQRFIFTEELKTRTLGEVNKNLINKQGKEKDLQKLLKLGDSFLYLPSKNVWGLWHLLKPETQTAYTNLLKTRAIHELTHALQHFFPEIQELFRLHFVDRTKNDTKRKLKDYDPKYRDYEETKADEFSNPYFGKVSAKSFYNNEELPLELITTHYQAILGNDVERLRKIWFGDKKEGAKIDRETLGFALASLLEMSK